MGVDKTESKRRTKAAKSSTDSGVAGRNMVIRAHNAWPWSRVEEVCRVRAGVLETRLLEKRCPVVQNRRKMMMSSYRSTIRTGRRMGVGRI
jgi:hypothetical protein